MALSDLDRTRYNYFLATLPPDALLRAQNTISAHVNVAQRATELLTLVNEELVRRGLCTICAKQHDSAQCPVLTDMRQRMLGDDPLEGGVLV